MFHVKHCPHCNELLVLPIEVEPLNDGRVQLVTGCLECGTLIRKTYVPQPAPPAVYADIELTTLRGFADFALLLNNGGLVSIAILRYGLQFRLVHLDRPVGTKCPDCDTPLVKAKEMRERNKGVQVVDSGSYCPHCHTFARNLIPF